MYELGDIVYKNYEHIDYKAFF